jgi:hypothetical protein
VVKEKKFYHFGEIFDNHRADGHYLKEQETRSKEQETRSKEQGKRNKD